MHILLSNDDGFYAPGIQHLYKVLEQNGFRLSLVAPRENKSGCGQAMSLRQDINCHKVSENQYIVDGTPVDCVYLATQCLLKDKVDLVISGINNGANLADDVNYSGTFAAAMEARRLQYPSFAVSVVEHDVKYYSTASQVVLQLLKKIDVLKELASFKNMAVLNINVPDIPYEQLKGFQATSLAHRCEPNRPVCIKEDGDSLVYRLAPAGDFVVNKTGHILDFQAVENAYVSVTPVSSQLMHHHYIDDVQQWLNHI